ncbi:hypothetical protein BU23DRAFT_25203 [Bimuria novae-zelandiae CBS 107.79]|uniref:Uncharacterized protein n=1 Tax=Bimuria novae-zelandiae CBS 107.79 TaxID=1447943 RepID=A0A6A5UNS3_9PLEO|nr:hypothetical protein BU23DRAFT_25203 [Bimuria novae-zelandiae CBS 107.79]
MLSLFLPKSSRSKKSPSRSPSRSRPAAQHRDKPKAVPDGRHSSLSRDKPKASLDGRQSSASRDRLKVVPDKRQRSVSRHKPQVSPDGRCQSLDFWVTKDKKEVVKRIVPYLTGQIPKNRHLGSLKEEKPWIEELIESEDDEDDEEEDEGEEESFSDLEAAFWKDPETITNELRDVTRTWFYMLLRYTFRTKHRDGWKKTSPAFDLEDFDGEEFTSQLDEKQVRALVRRDGLINEYKETYKETKQRTGWTRFCARLRSFTELVGLQTTSTKVEQILQELQKGLPDLKNAKKLEAQRLLIERLQAEKNSTTSSESVNALRQRFEAKQAESERILRERLEAKKAESERILRQQLEAKKAESERLLRQQLESKKAESERTLRARLEAKNAEAERKLRESLAAKNAEAERALRQKIEANAEAERKLREDLQAKAEAERKHRLHDALVSCRELMEKLVGEKPVVKGSYMPGGQQFKQRWKDLFHEQWTKCKARKPAGHPLLGLVAQQKYYVVGKELYGTISERLHNHREYRDKEVDADVSRMIFAILPAVYSKPNSTEAERDWNLATEKKRWGLA